MFSNGSFATTEECVLIVMLDIYLTKFPTHLVWFLRIITNESTKNVQIRFMIRYIILKQCGEIALRLVISIEIY